MTQSAADIMVPFDMIEVSIEDNARQASERVLIGGRSALVEAHGEACAILSLKGAHRLITQPGSLSQHHRQLRIIGQTHPNTNVIQLAEAMAYERTLDGFVVMERGSPVGLITMHRLVNVFPRTMFPSFGSPSFVNPPSGSCYCCPKIPHQVPPGTATRDNDDLACCPTHNETLIFKQPCTC